jgi:hypothetical protein
VGRQNPQWTHASISVVDGLSMVSNAGTDVDEELLLI